MQGTSFEVHIYWGVSPTKKKHERQKMAMVSDLMALP